VRIRRGIGTLLLAAGVAGLSACGDDTPPVPSLSLTQVASGLSSALYVTAPPGDTDRIFVVQQSGAIRVLRHDTLLTTPFLNLSGIISFTGERGLLSLAFDPNYASNGFFYVDYAATNGALTVARYHISADPNVGDATSAQVLLRSYFANTTTMAGW
jgi:glucose/arabinose dehydrogenase